MPSISSLFDRKLLLVTGKGGIGKTVVATSISLAAAAQGKRVCLVECADEDQIAPLLGRAAVGHTLTQFSENLHVINIDHRLNFRDFVVTHLGFEQLFDRVFNQAIVKSFVDMIPGLAEIVLLGRLYYCAQLAKDPAFDLVVFDGFASGHFLSLMRAPEAVLGSGLVGPVIHETERVKNFLVSDTCGIIMVGAPEPLVISEMQEFVPLLQQHSPTALKGLFINRVPGSREDVDALLKLGAADRVAAHLAAVVASAQTQLATFAPVVADLGAARQDFVYAELPELGWLEEPLILPVAEKLLNIQGRR